MIELPEYMKVKNLKDINRGENIRHYFAKIEKNGEEFNLEFKMGFTGLFKPVLVVNCDNVLMTQFEVDGDYNLPVREFLQSLLDESGEQQIKMVESLRNKFHSLFPLD